MELWMGIIAGGGFEMAWNEKDKLWYYPVFRSQDECYKFWHSNGRTIFGIEQVKISS